MVCGTWTALGTNKRPTEHLVPESLALPPAIPRLGLRSCSSPASSSAPNTCSKYPSPLLCPPAPPPPSPSWLGPDFSQEGLPCMRELSSCCCSFRQATSDNLGFSFSQRRGSSRYLLGGPCSQGSCLSAGSPSVCPQQTQLPFTPLPRSHIGFQLCGRLAGSLLPAQASSESSCLPHCIPDSPLLLKLRPGLPVPQSSGPDPPTPGSVLSTDYGQGGLSPALGPLCLVIYPACGTGLRLPGLPRPTACRVWSQDVQPELPMATVAEGGS